MRYGPHGSLGVFGPALLVADAVLIHATIQRSLAGFWGFPLGPQVASAAIAGLIGATLLAQGADTGWLRRSRWILVGGFSWIAAALIGSWAATEAMSGAPVLPQWWYAIHENGSGASGVTFFGGQAIAGAVAGIGLVLPILFEVRRTWSQRTVDAVVLIAVAALTWTAIFHARWVVCGFDISAPGATVDLPPPAA